MKMPPEAFLIFKEEQKKAELEKKKLREEYEGKIADMKEELLFLKEQIMAQQEMIKNSIEYITKVEGELGSLKDKMINDAKNSKDSFH
jgi:hypothetical protein